MATSINLLQCPICASPKVGGCRCSNNIKHDINSLRQGHGCRCVNGHRWTSQTADGKMISLNESEGAAKANKIKVVKVKGCPELDKQTLTLMAKYIKYAVQELGLEDRNVHIRLLGPNPEEPITTGAYNPADKTCTTIVGGRHLVDWCRTIAHELTHMKQDFDGKLNEPHPEIGGDIEDEANVMSGRITKYFIKKILTAADKSHLGLGSYGD